MLSDIIRFFAEKPDLLKRAVICNTKVVAWTTYAPEKVFSHWREITEKPLRLVPNTPLEGGMTQETWNKVWDEAEVVTNKIRYKV